MSRIADQKRLAEEAGLETAFYIEVLRCTKCNWSGSDDGSDRGGCPTCGASRDHCHVVAEFTLSRDSVGEIAELIGVPLDRWVGNCYAIACAIVSTLKLPKARAVYGHYRGPVRGGSMFKPGSFQRHGWVVLDNRVVVDPTRWVFEDVKPYLYIEELNDEYDEGEDQFRQELNDEQPAPRYDEPPNPDVVELHLIGEALVFVHQLLPDVGVVMVSTRPRVVCSMRQMFWLANLSRERLGKHAVEVYQALIDVDQRGAIPWDNRMAVLGA